MSMTVKEIYNGSGTTGPFDYHWAIGNESDLIVYKVSALGVPTLFIYSTNYTVTGVGSPNGGTITTVANVAVGETLFILFDPDVSPGSTFAGASHIQPYSLDGELKRVYATLALLLKYLERTPIFAEPFDPADFDSTLPRTLLGAESCSIVTNSDGTGWALGPNIDDITAAQQYAQDAEAARVASVAAQAAAAAAQANAEAAQTAAEAAQDAAEDAATLALTILEDGFAHIDQTFTQNTSGNVYTGLLFDPATHRSADFVVEITRGVLVFGHLSFSLFYHGGVWNVVEGFYRTLDSLTHEHGITFTMVGNQLQVDVDNSGAGNATLKIKKDLFAV